jgi:RHS repeat-associated protein
LPVRVIFDDNRRIEWTYAALGAKLRKTVYDDGALSYTKDYTGGFVHKQVNNFYPFGLELANIGMTSDNDNKFKYNAKELEDAHNLYWYHYGARYYDPQLGRWHSVDPKGTKASRHGSYVYAFNNPIELIDPTGEEPTQDRVGHLGNIANRLKLYKGNALETLRWASQYSTFGHAKERYIFTEKYGYVDLTHFFRATNLQHTTNDAVQNLSYSEHGLGGVLGKFVFETLGLGKISVDLMGIYNEIDQGFSDNIRVRNSAFSFEDIPSNSAGIDFANSLDLSKSLYEQFINFMKGAGAKDIEEIINEKHFQELYKTTTEAQEAYDNKPTYTMPTHP